MDALYDEHPAMFKNHPFGFIISILLIPVGVGILILLWWYLKCKGTRLVVSERELLLEEGLLSKHRWELNISGVRSVSVRQSFFNRIFGVGTIEIFTAGDKPEIRAAGMPDPEEVRRLIKARQNGEG